ncbi:hypothetical protein SAMN06296020_11946 [Anoxynatronum buryatiense]|uniref:Uncharacterized protein n=1 Tax=Anoxynatronum buryatiense TaxID=489973 RepID=A0AA45WYP3_9CLOT|nr:hypothetical protein SAMN06296020_11946 [Anoxynatronum buryatiense]
MVFAEKNSQTILLFLQLYYKILKCPILCDEAEGGLSKGNFRGECRI